MSDVQALQQHIEKLSNHIRGLQAQVQAKSDIANEILANLGVAKTNLILLDNALKQSQANSKLIEDELARVKAELDNEKARNANPLQPADSDAA